MDTARWNTVKEVFGDALALPPDQRAAFLAEACGADADLHEQVAALLASYDEAPAYFDSLAYAVLGSTEPMGEPDTARLADPHQLIGQTVSHYEVLEKLGRGGMGVVYKARDTRLDRIVALKFLPPHLSADTQAKQRFITEAKTASAIDHPNIGTIFEIGETGDGQLFIAMAYYEGQTLKEKIARGPLPLGEALDYTLQLAQGLAMAHAQGIVHRDVKPANVMIIKPAPAQTGSVVKILDFGIAKVADASLTKTGSTLGTVAYMSPEQAAGQQVDHRTDLWSLGVVLYEMLTGERPFKGEYDQAILNAIRHEDPAPVSSLRRDVPAALETVVTRCLQKDLRKRYPSVAALHKDLKRKTGLDQGVTLPRPATPRDRSARYRRIAAPVAGVLFLLVLVQAIPSVRTTLSAWLGQTQAPSQKHLAVLPFTYTGDDPEDRAFSDGLMEIVTSKLAQVESFSASSFWVVPSSEIRKKTVTSASEAHATFGVNLVVTGNLQRSGDQVRLIINLIDTQTLRVLKSTTITAPLADILAFQDGVVLRLTDMLDTELAPRAQHRLAGGGTQNPDAFAAYTQGRAYLQRLDQADNVEKAIHHFQQALALDSLYALAYVGLGDASWAWRQYDTQTEEIHWAEVGLRKADHALRLDDQLTPARVLRALIYRDTGQLEEALREIQLALVLDPSNADAYRIEARILARMGETQKAETAHQKAIDLRPAYWLGYNALGVFYLTQGRYEEAAEQFEQVTVLTPNNFWGYNHLGGAYYYMGRLDEAGRMFEHALTIRNDYRTSNNLATVHVKRERYDEAARAYEKALALDARDYEVWGNLAIAYRRTPAERHKADSTYRRAATLAEAKLALDPSNTGVMSHLAGYYIRIEKQNEALKLVDKIIAMGPQNPDVLYRVAIIYEQVGNRDKALAWMEKALQAGLSPWIMEEHPDLKALREDPRLQRLVKKFESDSSTP